MPSARTEQIEETAQKAPTVVVIGIGNEFRQDDAAGLLVARALKKLVPNSVQVLECTGASLELIDAWSWADSVVLVDAVSSGSDPGTIFFVEVHDQPIPASLFHYTTHDFNVSDSIELARLLGRLPKELVVYGIEGAAYGHGMEVSEQVDESIEEVTARVLEFVEEKAQEAEGQEA